eukprot:2146718-Lingulodinium_polyedra.AAC.1
MGRAREVPNGRAREAEEAVRSPGSAWGAMHGEDERAATLLDRIRRDPYILEWAELVLWREDHG